MHAVLLMFLFQPIPPMSQHMTYFLTGLRQVRSETTVVFPSHNKLLVFLPVATNGDTVASQGLSLTGSVQCMVIV